MKKKWTQSEINRIEFDDDPMTKRALKAIEYATLAFVYGGGFGLVIGFIIGWILF